jgi:hypothetical protein
VYDTGNTASVQISLNDICHIERPPYHCRDQSDQKQIGSDTLKYASGFLLKDIIDDIVIVLEEHDRSKDYIKHTYHPEFPRVVNKGIDTVHDHFRLCGHHVGKKKLLDFIIHFTESGKCRKDIEKYDQKRNNGKDGVPAQRRGVVSESVIKQIPEKVSDEDIIVP